MKKSEEHRGEIVEKIVRKSGIKLTSLVKLVGVKSHGTLYNWFSYQNLDWEKIEKIGRAIGHDFRIEFPDMPVYLKNIQTPIEVNEPIEGYGNYDPLKKCNEEMELWRSKYINLLETHNKLLKDKGNPFGLPLILCKNLYYDLIS